MTQTDLSRGFKVGDSAEALERQEPELEVHVEAGSFRKEAPGKMTEGSAEDLRT